MNLAVDTKPEDIPFLLIILKTVKLKSSLFLLLLIADAPMDFTYLFYFYFWELKLIYWVFGAVA